MSCVFATSTANWQEIANKNLAGHETLSKIKDGQRHADETIVTVFFASFSDINASIEAKVRPPPFDEEFFLAIHEFKKCSWDKVQNTVPYQVAFEITGRVCEMHCDTWDKNVDERCPKILLVSQDRLEAAITFATYGPKEVKN
ncbi:hypothetical protein EJ06DRAFT_519736 [Trichodelitschia bisporula]|uniref:Uncharacterized protein n=1 Tax=Trichodelitschia bisporula TaxID=703511 RepID=A0A6G1I338_9PEZI|nr:hypothetical protein EJ06DRAFT_519736 [Trichodelitschia bisporula]